MAWSDTIPYRKYREPYVKLFFAETAKILALTRASRLLDIACGTGEVAFGFAPYVGSLTGMEREQPMVDVARDIATKNNIAIRLICAEIETMPEDLGHFDIVTIGKAHWYLPRPATLRKLEEIVAQDGHVLICTTGTHDALSGGWAAAYRQTRWAWRRSARELMSEREFMEGAMFSHVNTIRCAATRKISVEDLVKRSLAYAGSSPKELGPDTNRYLEEIRAAIAPHAVNGILKETFLTQGTIFVRKS